MNIPTAASFIPRRAVSECESPRSPRRKRSEAIRRVPRYAVLPEIDSGQKAIDVHALASLLFLKHPQHPVRNKEPSHDVDRCRSHGHGAEDGADRVAALPGNDQRSHQGDSRDGIGKSHERRMKKLGHFRNHLVACENGQNKNVEQNNEIFAFHVASPDFRMVTSRISGLPG